MIAPVVVEFPLRGIWISPNTPGTRVPSHGTDMLGERYAYDFVAVDPGSLRNHFYRISPLRYLFSGVRLEDCYGWGQPIFSATAGIVLQAEDGLPERNPVHLARDVTMQIKNARAFKSGLSTDYRSLAGNYIIIESRDGYFVYTRAQNGSICVSPGETVVPGQKLANVGHSGNSTAPHLHFQVMDNPDPWKAQGIPCCFREYEIFQNGTWRMVMNGIPRATDRIRAR